SASSTPDTCQGLLIPSIWAYRSLSLIGDYDNLPTPFGEEPNISDWGADKLQEDPRWKYGIPPARNANYAWLQHMLARLSKVGRAGIVLANGSMTTQQSGEGDIRKAMIKDDVVECMVALPGQLFSNTQIPACLWFMRKDKKAGKGLGKNKLPQIRC
ncbi:HsdM family class I SAM-dependent methyltransferase, partial [Thiolapillus sp.]|uniref:HsdM family class I SAM-dependent methyltransferase n=1 Tax=Thiolapillus sp. TaxID=2017437 RepID=UPI003AF6CD23